MPDPLPGCTNAPWGWTQGQGNPGGNSGKCPGQGNGNGNGQTGPELFEKDQYFYHPDHLGSSSYVTDVDGEIFQHLEYFPFGETWVEESSNTQRTPYLFTGKELDEETGLYYFGARYYDPRTSVWQSPDPILAEYLSGEGSKSGVFNPRNLSLYAYSHQRPIAAVDPGGEDVKYADVNPHWPKSELGWLAGLFGYGPTETPAPDVFQMVYGDQYSRDNQSLNGIEMRNACATRGSIALGKADYQIGSSFRDFLGQEGEFQEMSITSTAEKFATMMRTEHYKGEEHKIISVMNPSSIEEVQEAFVGHKGIFVMLTKEGISYTGHVTLYDGENLIDGNRNMYIGEAREVILFVGDME